MKISKTVRTSSGKEPLVQELDALIRLYDVTEFQRLRDATDPKWWESGLVMLLFVSALGLLVSVQKLIPDTSVVIHRFVLFWLILFVVTVVGTMEFMLRKLRALRRLHEFQARVIARLMREHLEQSSGGEESRAAEQHERR